jgi:hypothetical protein
MTKGATRQEFMIVGAKSGWRRGPYKTADLAMDAASQLAAEQSEQVEVLTTVVTTKTDLLAIVRPPS